MVVSAVLFSVTGNVMTDSTGIEPYGGGNAVPGPVLNGRVKAAGRIASRAEIKRWIKEELK